MARLRYPLDANVLSESPRLRPNPGVESRLDAHAPEACTAAPILHELKYGLARLPDRIQATSVASDCDSRYSQIV